MPNMLPPPQYDHPPEVPVIEHVLTSDVVDRICWDRKAAGWDGHPPPPGYHFAGCAHLAAGRCEVWRIDDGTVRRHELGHCNGWPSNHPVIVAVVQKPVALQPAAVPPLGPIAYPRPPPPSWKTSGPPPALAPWPTDPPDRVPTATLYDLLNTARSQRADAPQ